MPELKDNCFWLKAANYHFYELRVTNSTLELHDLQQYYLYAYYWDQVLTVLITRDNRIRIRVKAIIINDLWFTFINQNERLRCQAYLECAHIFERAPRVGLWNFVRYGGLFKLKPSVIIKRRLQEELLQTIEEGQKEKENDEIVSTEGKKANLIICAADSELVIETNDSVIRVVQERENSLSEYELSPRPSFTIYED